MPGQNMIAPETLMTRIGTPDAPVLIDVCIDEDFALDPRLIPGAFRHPFAEVEALAPGLAGEEVVVICQKGLKLSQGAAALLRSRGVDATALAGGMVEWAARGLPAIPASALPARRVAAPASPSNDQLAALWLIRRFAVPDAQILFVQPNAAHAVADRFDATPLAGYDETLSAFSLDAAALRRIGDLMSGNAPEAPGLAAALAGLRAMHADDLACLAASLPLFDALHRAFADASEDAKGAAR